MADSNFDSRHWESLSGDEYSTRSMIRVLGKQCAGLKICHINAQSLTPKIDEFRYLFENSNIDIVCVCETWLSDDSFCNLNGFNVFRCDRSGRRGGGVAIFTRVDINSKIIRKSSPGSEIEYLFIEIKCNNNKLLVGSVYRPNRNIELTSLFSILDELTFVSPFIIVAGDFNHDVLRNSELVDRMGSLNLFPVNVATPTHFTRHGSTLLDMFFVSHIEKVLLYDQLSAPCFSNHDLIYLTFECSPIALSSTYCYRDFKNVNRQQLENDLSHIEWYHIYNMPSVDDQVLFFQNNFESLFNLHVPLVTKQLSKKNQPWFNNYIRGQIRERDFAYKRWKIFRLEALHSEYKLLRNRVISLIRDAKQQFFAPKFDPSLAKEKLWKNLREIGVGKQIMNKDNSIDCNELNKKFVTLNSSGFETRTCELMDLTNTRLSSTSFCFSPVDDCDAVKSLLDIKSNSVGTDGIHPVFLKAILPFVVKYITYIFNNILMTSTFPSVWKQAKIIPIPKNHEAGEYRPIAILPFLSKVLEKIINQQIRTFLWNNKLMCINQSGFRPKHSCTTALIDVVENIRNQLDKDKVTILTLLDFSKAFDTVNRFILCEKLKDQFHFSFPSVKLILSYLTGRSQAVFANNVMSSFLPLQRGVPQGSILGPLLFSMYINDLPSCPLNSSVHMYADDVQLYNSFQLGMLENGVHEINEDLNAIVMWSRKNDLCLNPKKTKCLVISRSIIDTSYFPQIYLNNCAIEFVESVKNLGLTFNKTLSWNTHINQTLGKVYGGLRLLWASHHIMPLKTRLILAKTLLVPLLLFCCEVFSNCDSEHKRKLNVAFNSITRYVYGLRRYDHISSFSKSIYGMSLDNLFKLRTLTMLHNIIQSHQPEYLYNKINFTRSERSCDIIPVRYTFLVSERQFYVHSIRLWNSLPRSVKIISSPTMFGKTLRELFS